MGDNRTVFKKADYDLSSLLAYLDMGDIGLPDIQRPFVWSAAKVRDLFDSMYRGFPVGYLLFWENGRADGVKSIGVGDKVHSVPKLLIVDGQQRLTSLYSVFRGKPVLDEDYEERRIEVAFRPRDGRFDVADAAIRKDPEFIADISTLWSSGSSSRKLVNNFLEKLSARRAVSSEEEEQIAHNLDRLFDLQKYPFTALEISSAVDEEQVADIFVRINSEGVKLNQSDFILTLLSVFAEDIRVQLESFCRKAKNPPKAGAGASPYNQFIQPAPDQLLRVGVALAFGRGRLKSVYQVLRGKDVATGEFSATKRDEQFARLRHAQAELLDTTPWHGFFNALVGAGYRSGELISSQTALIYAYAFYLMGRNRFRVPAHDLDKLVGRWFYTATLEGRYTNSPESAMDADLNLLKELKDGTSFAATLNKVVSETLTSDFWTIALPNDLATSSARSPALFAYYAAQNVLKAPVLFSNKRIPDLLDPAVKSKKRPLERHHLFPRAWLERSGVSDLKQINQAANYALLEWPDNIDISDDPPAKYVPEMRQRFSADVWQDMCRLHALPDGWEELSYEAFLEQRRRLMAAVIRQGFETLL